MLNFLLDVFFGCRHRDTSFPLTPARGAARKGMYVTCLDCGKEFHYNWAEMRIGEPVSRRATAAAANESLATVPVETWK